MQLRILIAILFSLLFTVSNANAGFLIKKNTLAAHSNVMKSTVTNTKAIVHEKSLSLLVRLNERFSIFHPYRLHKENEWFGIAAIGCGIIGLLVPGVNLLAILFGVLGMGRGCKVQGLAIAGFVMGMLELVLFLILQAAFISLILL